MYIHCSAVMSKPTIQKSCAKDACVLLVYCAHSSAVERDRRTYLPVRYTLAAAAAIIIIAAAKLS